MEYDLSKIYEVLTEGEKLEENNLGRFFVIKGNIAGFRIPSGGIITYLSHKGTGQELKIKYGAAYIEVGRKYMTLCKVPKSLAFLVEFLDSNIVGELDED